MHPTLLFASGSALHDREPLAQAVNKLDTSNNQICFPAHVPGVCTHSTLPGQLVHGIMVRMRDIQLLTSACALLCMNMQHSQAALTHRGSLYDAFWTELFLHASAVCKTWLQFMLHEEHPAQDMYAHCTQHYTAARGLQGLVTLADQWVCSDMQHACHQLAVNTHSFRCTKLGAA